jgi:hypothetical protein
MRDRFIKRLFIFGFALVVILPMMLEGVGQIDPLDPMGTITRQENGPVVTAQRKQHILYGDEKGGGHLYGTGHACKSEFPADWNADKVIQTIETQAANDNLSWRQQDNGYFVADAPVDQLKIRIVLDSQKKTVITAYPVNVARNPCPAANDNRRRD